MIKRYVLPFFLSLLFVFSLSIGVCAVEPEGNWNDLEDVKSQTLAGSGTYDDPYLIEDEYDLAFFSYNTTKDRYKVNTKDPYCNKFVKITAKELDMSAHYWTPAVFSGYFDGGNCVIKGITVSSTKKPAGYTGSNSVGFFYALNVSAMGANLLNSVCVVQNVHLENPQITTTLASASAGALVGTAQNVRIANCTVSGGSVFGESLISAGGLIGKLTGKFGGEVSRIEGCSSTATVTATSVAGGLIGLYSNDVRNEQIILRNCRSGGALSSNYAVGGLVANISNQAYGMDIEHCYSVSTVAGAGSYVGGLVGLAQANGTSNLCYVDQVNILDSVALNPSVSSESTKSVSAGRIASTGANVLETGKGSFVNNYALDVMSVLGGYAKDDESANGSGISRETASTRSFWETTVGFDFSENGVWAWDDVAATNGYPSLKKESVNYMALSIAMQPKDAVQYRDTPASFGVAPQGGALGYTYQWSFRTTGNSEWQDIEGATSATLDIGGGYLNGTAFRCTVTDQAGQTAVSEAATLTVTASKYTAEDAFHGLSDYYLEKGISSAKEAFSISRSVEDFSDYRISLPFWETYTARRNPSEVNGHAGYYPWSLLDSYALGKDPHYYLISDGGSSDNYNLIKTGILRFQDESTGRIYDYFHYYPIHEEDLAITILGLEMYYDGGAWENEKEGTMLGRDGALKYFFETALVKNEETGGLSVTYSKYSGSHLKDADTNIRLQLSIAEAAILSARLVDDPQWGKQAEEALSGLMKTLEYLYDTREEVSDNSGFVYTESLARYVSALIAAGNATDNWFKKTSYFNLADEVVKNEIMPAKCIDGGYNRIAGESAVTGDAKATAAVMMALGDYENQSSILMDYVFEVPDAAAANDLAAIVIDSPVTEDLELVATGAYGSAITWETSDKSVISASGKVTRGAEDQSVILTATATKGDAVATRSFVLTVNAKVGNAAEDALDAVLNGLNVPIETTHDITLGESADSDVALTWATSAADVLGTDGKVVRPAVGSADVDVTLTATATKGDLSKSKEFTVKVYAETGDNLKEAYYLTRDKYLNMKSISGYWKIWAAYAALGDYITDPANGYSLAVSLPSNEWYGTQYGASVNAIVAMGENPYNYQGKNWVKMLQDNYGGPYAATTYSELGMEAAGADSDYGFTPSASAGISMTQEENMKLGIDIAGWATTILGVHKGEEGVDEASKSFINYLKNTLGVSENGNFATTSGGNVNFISTGCGIMGMAALYSVGYEEADVTTWKNAETGKTPVDAVYNDCFIEQQIPGYDEQIEIALCDLYNAKYKGGTSAWVSCRVSGAKLAAQEAAAREILANAEAYEAESIEAIKTALAATAEISEERRNANIADYGEEYYALYDAVRYAALIGQAEKDAEAAAAVSETLNALKDASSLTLSDKTAVEAARAAYNALTDKQKELVDEAALAKLEAAEAAIAALDAAQGEAAQAAADKAAAKVVKNAINALPSEKDLLGSDAAAVEAARAAYDALSDAQKALVSEKTVAKLEAAEARMEALAGLDVVDIGAMTDVQESDWFYGDVAYALGNGLFKGMTATTFGPEASMTRGQFVTVLGRYAGVEDSSAAYPQQTIYSDVSANEYYAAHVKWATDNGITVGTSATTFSPESEITRQDMSVMMLRFAKAMGIILPAAGDALFADDAAIADYAKEAVYRMKAAGIVNGMGDNKFMPQEKSRRCEVAAVLHRFFTMEDPEDAVDTVVVSVEKFTLGQGYVVEPTVMELEDGDTAESVIYRLLEEEGIEYRCKTNYLIGIRDNDTSEAVFPQYILDQVDAEGGSLEERQESGWLKEFDYSSSSGWMYWVNNREPVIDGFSPGIAQYVMQPGDVMRFQFTVIGLGKDLGADGYGEPYVRPANKDALTVAAAKCNDKTSEAYQNALKVLMNMESSQAEVDAAAAALQ